MENKKNVIKEEDLEKVTGGAIAGLQFIEPPTLHANNNIETVPVSNTIQIPVNPVTPVNPTISTTPVVNNTAVKSK